MLKVAVFILGLVTARSRALNYGPCHDVTAEEFCADEWPGINFVNVMTYNAGVRCLWVNRHVEYADGHSANTTKENVQLGEDFSRMENGTEIKSTLLASYVDGQYQLTKELGGTIITLKVTWVHFDLPQLECHYACSNDDLFKNGYGAFFCESGYPDALKENACKIKEIAEASGFSVSDLMMVDNCDCPNIPFEYKSNCEQITVQDYFSGC